MSGNDPLSEVCARLEGLAAVSDELREAIDAADGDRIGTLAEKMQRLAASMQEAPSPAAIDPSTVPPETLGRLQSAMSRAQAGSDALKAWLAKLVAAPAPAPPPAANGPAAGLARGPLDSLPEGWDFEHDVAVLVGDRGAELARELAAKGQERLLVYLPEGQVGGDMPPRALVVRSQMEMHDAILLLPGRLPERGAALRAPGADASVHEEAGRTLRETLESMTTHRHTVEVFGEAWALQGAANLPHVASSPSIDALAGAFSGKPCIIVSPGPSLDKNVHLLPGVKDRALVVTSSHALHALERAGVVPDLVLALDSQDLRYHLDGCALDRIGALLLGVTVHPELYRRPARRIFSFAGNSIIDQWVYECLGDDARLPAGGSVSCSALALALRWRCDPIILVGQDLAFASDQYYSRLSVDADVRVSTSADAGSFTFAGYTGGFGDMIAARPGSNEPMRVVEAPGYYGGTVLTSFMFQLFRRSMETMARSETGRTRLYNCTEGGARIDGFENVPLAAAIEQHVLDPLEVEAALDRALEGTDRAERRKRMRERVREILAALDRCTTLAADCSRFARQAKRNRERLRPLGDAEAKLTAALQPVLFISLLAQARITDARERGMKAKDLQTSLDASLELYDTVARAGEKLRPVLARALEELL